MELLPAMIREYRQSFVEPVHMRRHETALLVIDMQYNDAAADLRRVEAQCCQSRCRSPRITLHEHERLVSPTRTTGRRNRLTAHLSNMATDQLMAIPLSGGTLADWVLHAPRCRGETMKEEDLFEPELAPL